MSIGHADRANAALSVEVAEHMIGIAALGVRGAWQKHKAYRATCAELNALTDRQLGDLGIGRKTIKAVAHRAVYGA